MGKIMVSCRLRQNASGISEIGPSVLLNALQGILRSGIAETRL